MIGIYTNKIKDINFSITNKLKELLQIEGISFRQVEENSSFNDLELLIVLGGDGTILHVVKECALNNIAILGINLGSLGFMAEFENSEIESAVLCIKNKNYLIEERSMITTSFNGKNYYALNDIIISRVVGTENLGQVVYLDAFIDGAYIDKFIADGLLVSTPTGSTAYSLSAGGAILTPDLKALLLTPICSHSLHNKPIVFSETSEVKIEVVNINNNAVLSIDGKIVGELKSGDSVIIKKAKLSVKFIRKQDSNFYNKLLKKLNKWSNTI